ncbi:MAG: hypothetical protein EXQ79_04275 [Acidimicrobiia bacterium]|nr:hypothetical protein [Acidimicrobiia bacterium]
MARQSRHLAWRRNWWLFAALGGFTVALMVLIGSDDVIPYTSSKSLAAQTRADGAKKKKTIEEANGLPGHDVKNSVDVFDSSIVHTITIKMAPTAYDTMISDYQVDGVKTWHQATVVIDGKRINHVGVRLKGNSTLIGLRNSGPNPPGGIAASLGTLSPDDPHKMPFLFRFDEFLAGQRYEGVNELALRTSAGGFGGDVSQTTELVANELTKESGQPYLRAATTGMSFNGSPEGFYIVIEHPDDLWADSVVAGKQQPALYKAIVGARFHYVGDDPALYGKVFNQQSETADVGPSPMIDFLKFVETATDEQFEAELPTRLDTEEFARYLAFHNILVDTDSFAGTGNNYYFLYDVKLKQMSIASWDQNLAFARLGIGGGSNYRPYYEDGSGIPIGIPGLEELIPGEAIGEKKLLVDRFFATPQFLALYDAAYRELFKAMLTSGRADELVDEYSKVILAANNKRDLVDPDRFASELKRNHTFIAKRVEFLESIPPVAA